MLSWAYILFSLSTNSISSNKVNMWWNYIDIYAEHFIIASLSAPEFGMFNFNIIYIDP
jgi:hypothetical protein